MCVCECLYTNKRLQSDVRHLSDRLTACCSTSQAAPPVAIRVRLVWCPSSFVSLSGQDPIPRTLLTKRTRKTHTHRGLVVPVTLNGVPAGLRSLVFSERDDFADDCHFTNGNSETLREGQRQS